MVMVKLYTYYVLFQSCSNQIERRTQKRCVDIRDYDFIFDELPSLIEKHNWNSILLGKKWAYSGGASYAIYNVIPKEKITFNLSPVMLMKAVKNKV